MTSGLLTAGEVIIPGSTLTGPHHHSCPALQRLRTNERMGVANMGRGAYDTTGIPTQGEGQDGGAVNACGTIE